MEKSNVLVIGSGGREHVLTWVLAQSPQVETVFASPGNGGMTQEGTLVELDLSNPSEISSFINKNNISLTLIGPEAPLVAGLSDALRQAGHVVLGASQKAAQLEGSKIFAKQFMERYGIPTAPFKTFNNPAQAKEFIQSKEGKNYLVLKADGLAAGKGVFVCKNTKEMEEAIETVLVQKKFGPAGDKILIEEKLAGPEISVIALCDGKTMLPFPASQDHKRAFDNDQGPNTGGMGCYAPTPFYTEQLKTKINQSVVDNFLRGIKSEGLDFRGIIYFGLMMTDVGPMVLEFNVRFGDPEAQVILPLIETDLYHAFLATAKGELSNVNLKWKLATACTVVMASGGYPGSYKKGLPITGLPQANRKGKTMVFHAGTKKIEEGFVTNGGRVLNVTGIGKDLDQAVVRAYQAVKKINFKDHFFRNDIGAKALRNKNLPQRIKRMKKRHAKEFVSL